MSIAPGRARGVTMAPMASGLQGANMIRQAFYVERQAINGRLRAAQIQTFGAEQLLHDVNAGDAAPGFDNVTAADNAPLLIKQRAVLLIGNADNGAGIRHRYRHFR